MKKWSLLLLVPALSLLHACKGDPVDTEQPDMVLRFISPTPTEGTICDVPEQEVLYVMDTSRVTVEVSLEDDIALGEFKIDIHSNFDCHGHGGLGSIGRPPAAGATEDWRLIDIVTTEGKTWTKTMRLSPPSNVTAGAYHLSFQALDEVGNATESQFFSMYAFNSQDTVPPVLDLAQPAQMKLGVISKGTDIVFEGQVSDNHSLTEGGNGIVFLAYQDLGSGNYFQGPFIRLDANGDDRLQSFSLTFTVPTTLVRGDYRLILRSADGVNNLSQPLEFHFNVP
jgi:hypothetical protein